MDLETLHALIDQAQIDHPSTEFNVVLVDSATNKRHEVTDVYINPRTGNFSLVFKETE